LEEEKVTKEWTKEGLFLKQSQTTLHSQALIPIAPRAAVGMPPDFCKRGWEQKVPTRLECEFSITTPGIGTVLAPLPIVS